MRLNITFKENAKKIATKFGEIYNISDGGYERGYAEGETAGYANGYTEGETKGKEQGYTEGYAKAESVNPFYYAYGLSGVFLGAGFPDNYEAVIKVQKAPVNHGSVFFQASGLKSVKWISEDNTNIMYFSSAFRLTNVIPTMEVVDFTEYNTKFSTVNECFRGQRKLKSIFGALDVSNCISGGTLANAFMECPVLEDVEFKGTIPQSINFQWSPLISVKSMKSVISCLADYSGTSNEYVYKVTFTEQCWAALEADSKSPTGTTWAEYVDSLGWMT